MDSYILNTNNILPIKLPVISRPKFLMCWNIVNFFGELITSEEGCIMTSTESDKTGFYYSQWKQFHSYINTYDITMIGTKNQCNYLRDLVKSYKMIMGRVSDCITYIEVNDKNDVEKELNKLINKNAKFDVCLMNPPYGSRGSDDIHYRFTEKCISICDNVICIMPFSLISNPGKVHNDFRSILSPNLINVTELNANKLFPGTTQESVGIYTFSHECRKGDGIITYIDGTSETFDVLTYDVFNGYEKHIVSYLKPSLKEGEHMMWCGYTDHPERHYSRISKKYNIDIDKLKSDRSILIEKLREEQIDRLPVNKVYLTASVAYSPGAAIYFTSKSGLIFNNKKDVFDMLVEHDTMSGYNFLIFDTETEAQNCKIAMCNPVIRFTLAKTHKDRHMKLQYCYQYIPNIDWSDLRVVTDEGLLEVCGCPKDKCKEYAEYCRKYMEEFDKQHESKKKKNKKK